MRMNIFDGAGYAQDGVPNFPESFRYRPELIGRPMRRNSSCTCMASIP
jgi:hypothetical protein